MTKSKTTDRIFGDGIPNTFVKLCMVHIPRPIHDKAEYGNAMEIVHALAGLELNDEQEDYLETLSVMVNYFEEKQLEKLPKATPLEVLKYLVEANNISGRELGRILGKDESLGAKILSGERGITLDHAKKLAARFGIGPSAFLDI